MIGIINAIIEQLGQIIAFLLNLLPNSPFTWDITGANEILAAINWLFPIQAAVIHLQFFVFAVAVYYGLRIALRWAKAAGG